MTKLRHYDNEGTARFVTFSTYRGGDYLLEPDVPELFIRHLEAARSKHDLKLLGYVIMPDHVHLVLLSPPGVKLGLVVREIKSRMAREYFAGIGRIPSSPDSDHLRNASNSGRPHLEPFSGRPRIASILGRSQLAPFSGRPQLAVGNNRERKLSSDCPPLACPPSRAVGNSQTAQRVFWQKRCYDHNCRSTAVVKQKIEYCHLNPVRGRLVASPGDYKWSSYNWYRGEGDVPLHMDAYEF